MCLKDYGSSRKYAAEACITLGRAKGNDIEVPDGPVSWRRCAFALQGGQLFLRDLGLKNGTILVRGGAGTARGRKGRAGAKRGRAPHRDHRAAHQFDGTKQVPRGRIARQGAARNVRSHSGVFP